MAVDDALEAPVRWIESPWAEEDARFFFELDAHGQVLRQVELRGPDAVPVTAAALVEVLRAGREGPAAVRAYEGAWGRLAEHPVSEWDPGFPHVEIDRARFESVWTDARRALGAAR